MTINSLVEEMTGEALASYEFLTLDINTLDIDRCSIWWTSSKDIFPNIGYYFLIDKILTSGTVTKKIFRENKEEFFFMIPEEELAEIERVIERYKEND